jgi:hypothetical protein
MMRRLFIHTGAQKTATSSQQSWLFKNSAWLRDQGIAYPAELIDAGGNRPDFPKALTRSPESRTMSDRRVLLELAAFLDQNRPLDCLISAEGFNKPLGLKGTSNLIDSFSDTGRSVTTLTFVRPQADFMSSLYGHRTKALYPLPPFSAAMDLHDLLDHCDWNLRDETYRSAGFEPRFSVFRGSAADPVHEFLKLIGLDAISIPHEATNSPHANPSLGSTAVPVCRHLANHLNAAAPVEATGLAHKITRRVSEHAKRLGETRFVGPDPTELSRIAERYRDSNSQFLRRNPHLPPELVLDSQLAGQAKTPSDIAELTGEDREKAANVLEAVRAEFVGDPAVAAANLTQAFRDIPRI